MQPVDLVVEARWVIPIVPHGVIHENHSVVVSQGVIVDCLPHEVARVAYLAKERITRHQHAVMPGLVNAHTHNPMTLMRGLADDLPLMRWLEEHIWPAERKVVGAAFVRDGIELAIAEMLRGGTTCCNENYFFPDVAAATYKKFGFRALVGLPVIEFPSAWAQSADEYFDKGAAVHDDYRKDPLVRAAWAPHAPYTVSDKSFERVQMLADQLSIPVHLHLHETAGEIQDSKKNFGLRPMQRLQAIGVLTDQLIAVHMTQLTGAEIELCAQQGVKIVHCPESNLKLASGICPVAKLERQGATVALGTDGCASNNDLDMFGEMRTAALLGKVAQEDASALDAATVLRMATLDGARALGFDHLIGSLEKGKQADLIAIALDQLEDLPIYNPIAHLVYSGNRKQVSDAWVAGRPLLAERILLDQDIQELKGKARYWQRQIQSASEPMP